jgi:hypothetical protein
MPLDYENIKTNVNAMSGAWTTITIAADGTGQGADIPCRYCRLQSAASNSTVNVRLGAAATVSTGMVLPPSPTYTPYAVSNTNQLYFYGTSGNVINVEYFR